jgi:hypothetical protein
MGLRTGKNEAAAHALVVALKVAGIEARAIGGGVHWQVEIASTTSRTLLIHCFWYERALSGLFLGMNPANSRSMLKSAQVPREGPEYLVVVKNDGTRVAEGRSCIVSNVVACARAWLASANLDALAHAAPFVDQNGRLMRALAHRLDSQLRWDIGDDPGYELWVYGNARSCKIESGDGTVACSFFIGQAQVARAAALEDVPTAVAAWLLPGISVRELPVKVPGVEIERHADVLEVDPARWHWLHVRDRMHDSRDVLTPLRDLIAVLADSDVAKRFYCYSSLNRLCFSASSHYPWVNQNLPVVGPAGEGACVVDATRCDIGGAAKLIEDTLAAYAIRPFFGSAPHHEILLLSEQLSRQGSALRAEVVQRGAWFHLVVANRARRCDVAARHVTFREGTQRRGVAYQSLEDAVRGIRRYLEDGASLDELAPGPTTTA